MISPLTLVYPRFLATEEAWKMNFGRSGTEILEEDGVFFLKN